MRRVWSIAATAPAAPLMRDNSVVCVNFHLRLDATGHTRQSLLATGSDLAPWLATTSSIRSRWAGELALFAGDKMAVGDLLLLWVAGEPDLLFAIVTGRYEPYSGVGPEQPHARPIEVIGFVPRSEAERAGSRGLPRGLTLRYDDLEDEVVTRLTTLAGEERRQPGLKATSRGTEAGRWIWPLGAISAGRGPTPDWDTDALDGLPLPRCPKPARQCANHTPYRYLHRLHIDSHSDGHDLLIIAFNPNCPDDESSPTFGNGRRFAEANGARSCTYVNVLPIRHPSRTTLDATKIAPSHLDDNLAVIRKAAGDASAIVIAWGSAQAHPASRSLIRSQQRAIDQIALDQVAAGGCTAWRARYHPQIWLTGPVLEELAATRPG